MEEMPSTVFDEWWDYFLLEPWGEERADLRAGQICALIYAANKGKNAAEMNATDFMLFKEPPELSEPDTDAEIGSAVRRIAAAFGVLSDNPKPIEK